MSRPQAPTGETHGACTIRVAGHLETRWMPSFDGLDVDIEGETTVIRGDVADQAALVGLLLRLRDVGLPLISVEHTEPEDPPGSSAPHP